MKNIRIGDATIPLDAYAIGGTALLGIRGSGKTYGAKGIAEQLLEHRVPIIVFDPIGVWRFLKVPATKNGKGYPVVVAGGRGADLPLTPANAAEIVRAAMRENISLVVDLYDRALSKSDWRRIVQTCFRTLLYENEGMRHIFLEEAAEYCPQKVQDGETYAEVEKLVRMGGNASLGITLINQRAQEVNKAVLDLCENLVLMRQMGAHAIDALEKWIDKVSPDASRKIAAGMPKMQAGEAWVFVGGADHPVHTRTVALCTFHPDRKNPDAKVATAATDTSSFVAAMQRALPALAEQQAANDPKALKAEVARLKKLLDTRTLEVKDDPAVAARIATLEQDNRALEQHRDELIEQLDAQREALRAIWQRADGQLACSVPTFQKPSAPPRVATTRLPADKPAAAAAPRPTGPAKHELGLAERKVLTVLAQHGPCDASKLALLAGYTYSGGFRNTLSSLRTSGLIEGANTGTMSITQAGINEGPFEPLPTGAELREHWLRSSVFGAGERKVLQALLDNPQGLDAAGLCAAAGYEYSGGFRNYLSTLRTAGVLVGKNTEVMRASEDLLR